MLTYVAYKPRPWKLTWRDSITGEQHITFFFSEATALAFETMEQEFEREEKELFSRSWRRSAASRRKGSTVVDIARRYLELHPLADVTRRTCGYHLRPVLRLVGRLHAHLLDVADINAFRMAQRLRGVSPATVNQRVSVLRTVLLWAVTEGLIKSCPLSGLRLPPARSRRVAPPSLQEAHTLYAHAAPHVRRVILMGVFTGARIGPSELFRLRWADVDLAAARARMPNAAKNDGPDARDIPLRPDILPVLRRWAEADALLGVPWVIHWQGRAVRSIAEAWGTAKRRAGVTRRLRPYDLRHAFATYALAGGGDRKAVSVIMGHKDEAMILRVYQHVQDQQMADAVTSVPMMFDLRE